MRVLRGNAARGADRQVIALTVLAHEHAAAPHREHVAGLGEHRDGIAHAVPRGLVLLYQLVLGGQLPGLPELTGIDTASESRGQFAVILSHHSSYRLIPPDAAAPITARDTASHDIMILSHNTRLFE